MCKFSVCACVLLPRHPSPTSLLFCSIIRHCSLDLKPFYHSFTIVSFLLPGFYRHFNLKRQIYILELPSIYKREYLYAWVLCGIQGSNSGPLYPSKALYQVIFYANIYFILAHLGKENFYQIITPIELACGYVSGTVSLLLIDGEGPSPLWVVLSLGRWSWDV